MTAHPGLAAVATALGIDLVAEEVQLVQSATLTAIAARTPFAGGHAPWTPLRPILVVADEIVDAASLIAVLGPIIAPETDVHVLPFEGNVVAHTFGDLPAIPMRALLIAAADPLGNGRDPRALQQVVAHLRAPDGCPWDREQTIASLRGSLIDELYEAVDAIDAGDLPNLVEELGDLTLLIAMLSQIAYESGSFSQEDVWHGITTKIVRRHPHVFDDVVATAADDVVGVWADVKAKERAARSGSERGKELDGEPRAMPALERANRVLRTHPIASEPFDGDHDAAGDMLLALVASLCSSGIDPDLALRSALNRHVTTADPPCQGDTS